MTQFIAVMYLDAPTIRNVQAAKLTIWHKQNIMSLVLSGIAGDSIISMPIIDTENPPNMSQKFLTRKPSSFNEVCAKSIKHVE